MPATTARVPLIGSIAWGALLVQVAVAGLLVWGCRLAGAADPLLFGVVIYTALALLLRKFIAREHRRGVRLARQGRHAEAIAHFGRSVDHFTAHPWIDRFRSIILLSASRMGYREMGLCNMAFCLAQTGEGEQALDRYRQVLREYPGNGLAIAGINLLQAVKQTSTGN
jgi:tetratricopeptide (TPR) repeat protein